MPVGAGSSSNPRSLMVGMHPGTVASEGSFQFSTKLNTRLSYNPATTLLVLYPQELKTYAIQTFIAALFIIAQLEATKMPCSRGVAKLWNIQTTDCDSVYQEVREPRVHITKWSSQSEKTEYCRIQTRCPSGKGRTMGTVKTLVVARGWGRER